MSVSDAKIEANRANSLLSTGPKTPEGKAKSSQNALKTGLTARTVVLTDDDLPAYQAHVARFFDKYKPGTDDERELTQKLADAEWRLLSIPAMQSAIYAVGRKELASLYEDEDQDVAAAMLEAKVFLVYQRQLNNLSIQEHRIRSHFEKTEARLLEIQKPRQVKRTMELGEAVSIYLKTRDAGKFVDLKQLGFEFEMTEILERVARILASREGATHEFSRARQILAHLHAEEAKQKRQAA